MRDTETMTKSTSIDDNLPADSTRICGTYHGPAGLSKVMTVLCIANREEFHWPVPFQPHHVHIEKC